MLVLALAALLLEPLAARHRLWLSEDVASLVTAAERARFEALPTSEARDAFIEGFWRRRDPTPGTARNEAREAHGARLAASDRLFGPPDRGRHSQRGRLYQLLGPPSFRESFASAEGVVPLELWHYTGVTHSFLPDSFYLVFFQRDGQGPFRLWSPEADGVDALLRDPQPGRARLDGELAELGRIDPELEAVALGGLTPGAPSRSIALLADLDALPELLARERAPLAATRADAHFARLEASLDVAVLRDDAGVAEIHWALGLAPGESERLAWRREAGRLRTELALVGRVSGVGGELDGWEDELALEVEEGSVDALRVVRFSFRGRRPLVSGASRLALSLASPGGAFAVEERPLPDEGLVVVRAAAELAPPRPPGLPFRLGARLLMPGDVPAGAGAVALFQGDGDGALLSFELLSGEERLWSASKRTEGDANGVVTEPLPTESLTPGAYRLRVRSGDRSAETTFRVAELAPGEERVVAREPSGAERARYRRARAEAFLRAGHRDRAIEELELATSAAEGDLELELLLATLRYAAGQCEPVLRRLHPLADEARDPDVFVLLGACSELLGDLPSAERSYERAVTLSPEDSRIRDELERLRRRNN